MIFSHVIGNLHQKYGLNMVLTLVNKVGNFIKPGHLTQDFLLFCENMITVDQC